MKTTLKRILNATWKVGLGLIGLAAIGNGSDSSYSFPWFFHQAANLSPLISRVLGEEL